MNRPQSVRDSHDFNNHQSVVSHDLRILGNGTGTLSRNA
jgi:hypothetical protein